MKDFLRGSLLGKVVATIMAFVYILNLVPTWYATELLFKNSLLRIVLFVVFILFWIPATVASIWWIWFAG